MSIEKQLRQEQIKRRAESYANAFFEQEVEYQRLWLVALYQEKEHQIYSMAEQAARAQEYARIAMARSMGMSEEMIQKHLQG